ncbi:MAG TPA: discoidin domain-containing protein, partial [Polyangia bacterium]|nr:discoidin domain-containing protein [Polyangia bacterium]
MRRAAFIAIILCLTESAVQADEVIWAGAGSSTWSTGSNWVGGSVPATTDIAAFKGWAPLPRTSWTVTASNTYSTFVASNTKDGRGTTYWQTGALQASGQWVKIDLGSTQTFGGIDIDNTLVGASSTDYPRGFDIYASSDGTNWGTAFYSGTGSASNVQPRFSDQTARYIKIQLNTGNGTYWWTIGELTVWNTAGDAQFATTSMTASASAVAGGAAGNVIDWDLSTVWSPGASQVNGQWIKLDLGANRTFSSISMDAYSRTGDYPRGYNVEVSTNNSTWSSVATGNPSGEFSHVTFTAQTARYIRVTQTGTTSGGAWWSMYELHVYGTPSNVTTSASTTLAGINHTSSITFTQGSGHTITLTGDWNQSAGTFAGGSSQISVSGDFNLSGGTHTATSDILVITGAFNKTGGTFTHNGGRVLLASTNNQTFATNGATFNDLAINDGMVGYWKLDDGTTPIVDSSGYGQDGTLSNTPTWGAGPTLNFTNANSITLNGTNQYGRISRTTTLEPAAVTVSAWVKRSGSQLQFAKIVSKTYNNATTSPYGSYELQLNPGGADSSVVSFATGTTGPNSSGITSATGAIPDGTWTHVVGTYDPSASAPQKRLYVNGASVATTTLTGALLYDSTSTGDLYIGNSGNTQYLKGSVDDVRIYNRTLSAAEINSLYIGNQPGTMQATQTMTGSPVVVLGDLILASGKLDIAGNSLSVGGNWNNYGGIFAGTGTVSLTNGCCTYAVRSAGQPFYNLQLNGTNGIWNLEDWLKVSNTLSFFQNGTLVTGSKAIHAGNISKTSGTLTAGTGTVVIETTGDVTEGSGFSFNNLRVETPDETGLVGYWKFDEGQGTTVRDASGTGNDGTLSGNANWTGSSLASIAFDNPTAVTFN